jgi:A/G-specific adenine glycosylase
LHACAKKVVEEYQGQFPKKSEELQKLPGIGPYTSAAIASISFGESIVAIDGNLHRVISRLYAHKKDRDHSFTLGQKIIDEQRAGDFNQALMDLGSSICISKNPKCETCPLSSHCKAFLSNRVAEFPLKKKKKPVPQVLVLSAILILEDEVFLCKRPSEGLFGGLLENPSFWMSDADSSKKIHKVTLDEKKKLLKAKWKEEFAMDIEIQNHCGNLVHKLTHRHLYTDVFIVDGNVPTSSNFYEKVLFQSPNELSQVSTFCEKTVALYNKIKKEGQQLSLFSN